MIKFYDLAGRDDRLRFSPFCWRTKLALKHKGLAFETVPWRFTEKDLIAPTKQGRVPVLVIGDEWLNDSWAIAVELDRRYPDRPPLMETEAARLAAQFMNFWCDFTLHPALRALVFLDVYNQAAEKDRPYFRENREKILGKTLEELCGDRPAAQQAYVKIIAPVEQMLAANAYLGGARPNYTDYVLFGSLLWPHVVSGTPFLPDGSAAAAWFARMLDLFDGYARHAPTVRDLAVA